VEPRAGSSEKEKTSSAAGRLLCVPKWARLSRAVMLPLGVDLVVFLFPFSSLSLADRIMGFLRKHRK
jgi:hypothetical protein